MSLFLQDKIHHYETLIDLFSSCFEKKYHTILVRGDTEPLYMPSPDAHTPAQIIFAHGYYASALHEIAHWLIAGKHRRTLLDYGYWYQPDGRSASQQAEFEHVEAKPQALEWILSTAAGFRFHLSCDNLSGEPTDRTNFKQAVFKQAHHYLQKGLPHRARILHNTMCSFYQTGNSLSPENFLISYL